MFKNIGTCFKKFFCFKGRATRREYWSFVLFTALVTAVITAVAFATGNYEAVTSDYGIQTITPTGIMSTVSYAFSAIVFFPTLSVTVRRLHDRDHSAWWLLLYVVCCIGEIIMLVQMLSKGNEGGNEYGKNPRD